MRDFKSHSVDVNHPKKVESRANANVAQRKTGSESTPGFEDKRRDALQMAQLKEKIEPAQGNNPPVQMVKHIRLRSGKVVPVPDDYVKKKNEKWAADPAGAAVAAPVPVAAAGAGGPVGAAPVAAAGAGAGAGAAAAPSPVPAFMATAPGNLTLSGGARGTLAGTPWFKVLYGDPNYSLHLHVNAHGGIDHNYDKLKHRSTSKEYYVTLPSAINAKVKALNPFKKKK